MRAVSATRAATSSECICSAADRIFQRRIFRVQRCHTLQIARVEGPDIVANEPIDILWQRHVASQPSVFLLGTD